MPERTRGGKLTKQGRFEIDLMGRREALRLAN
jgi:hypothetical protein